MTALVVHEGMDGRLAAQKTLAAGVSDESGVDSFRLGIFTLLLNKPQQVQPRLRFHPRSPFRYPRSVLQSRMPLTATLSFLCVPDGRLFFFFFFQLHFQLQSHRFQLRPTISNPAPIHQIGGEPLVSLEQMLSMSTFHI